MDTTQIDNEIEEVVSTSPATTAQAAKRKITYKSVPMDEAISNTTAPSSAPATNVIDDNVVETQQNDGVSDLVNTTRMAPKTTPTIHINDGSRNAAKLVGTGGDSYLGGSVSPNSTVNATLRPMSQYGSDPFWLESTERFTPVEPWTAKLAVLNEPVKANTYDVDKFAKQIARGYLSIPEEDFFGYEYTPKKPFKESWYSAAVSDFTSSVANIYANTYSAISGLFSEEEAKKTPEQRRLENLSSEGSWYNLGLGAMRRAGQQYLDYLNQLEPIERGRGAKIAGAAGSYLAYRAPSLLAAFSRSPLAWAVGSSLTSAISASETLGTRDAILENGGTVKEAQTGQWKHLGFVGGTELLTDITGNLFTSRLIDATIKRGGSRAFAKLMGFAGEMATEGVAGSAIENYQDRVGRIIAQKESPNSLFAPWTEEEWNNFYGGLIASSLGAGAGGISRAGERSNRASDAFNKYMGIAATYKKALVDTAKERGVTLPESVMKGLDDIALQIWENPNAILDEDMRHVAQGYFDSLKDLDPEMVEQAQQLLSDPNAAQLYSEKAFEDFDNKIKSQPWYSSLDEEQQGIIRGIMRGMAYVGTYFFGTPPSEVKIPGFIQEDFNGSRVGVFYKPNDINKQSFELDPAINQIKKQMADGGVTQDSIDFFAEQLKKAYNDPGSYIKYLNAAKKDLIKNNRDNQRVKDFLGQRRADAMFEYLVETALSVNQPGGTVVVTSPESLPDLSRGFNEFTDGTIFRTPGYDYLSKITALSHVIENMMHEFSHANDWQMTNRQVKDFAEFVKWFVSPIARVFGDTNAHIIKEEITSTSEPGVGYVNLGATEAQREGIKVYSEPSNITEWRAQAVGTLMRQAAEYNGLMGNPAKFVQAAVALLSSINETVPLKGMSAFVTALRETVKENSDVVNRFRKSVPAEKMHAAIVAYMGGDENINWNNITPMSLKEFAESIDGGLLNSNALDYAIRALGDIQLEDFVDKAQSDWNETWDKIEARDPETIRTKPVEGDELKTEDKVAFEREHNIDGGINPEEDEKIEDWSSPVEQAYRPERDVAKELYDMAQEELRKEPSTFQKNITRKFNNKTLEESMKDFDKAMDEHKFVRPLLGIDFLRGPFAFLSALGGQRLVDEFDLVGRNDDYTNRVIDYNESMVKSLLKLFGGSRWKYEDYVRATGVPMYEIDYKLPSGVVERRMVSKRELMSGILYDEQPDSKERIAKTVDINEIKKYLDDFDIKFAYALRDILYNDYRKVKKDTDTTDVPKNYWPIMDSYAQERGDTQIVNDFGRKETDEPIGLVDVMAVMGGYMSRRAGAESKYFAALRRLNSVINYDKRKSMTGRMNEEDINKNEELDKLSSEIQRKIKAKLGTANYERFRDSVADTITHRSENDLKDSLASKISRNVISGLLIGKIKQMPINLAGLPGWLGYEHNTYLSFIPNVIKALLNPVGSWNLAMQNATLRNRRALYRYNEVMHKNLSANADNFATYVADWATRHNIYTIEAFTDLIIHLGSMFKKTLAFTLRESDAFMNAIGYAASYEAARNALGSDEAAQRSLSNYLNTTQSTSNSATKGLGVRKLSRAGFWGTITAFTSEPTQRFGSSAQAMNQYLSGEMPFGQMSRILVGNTMAMAAYVAVQAGFLTALIMPFFGGKMSDDDWDRVYENALRETVAAAAGISGPYSNAIGQPFLDQLFFDYSMFGGNNIPMLAEFARATKEIKKGKPITATERALSFLGILNGLPNATSIVRAFDRGFNAKTQKEKNAAILQAFGYSEAKANNMSGIKRKTKKK